MPKPNPELLPATVSSLHTLLGKMFFSSSKKHTFSFQVIQQASELHWIVSQERQRRKYKFLGLNLDLNLQGTPFN